MSYFSLKIDGVERNLTYLREQRNSWNHRLKIENKVGGCGEGGG